MRISIQLLRENAGLNIERRGVAGAADGFIMGLYGAYQVALPLQARGNLCIVRSRSLKC